MAKVIPCCPPLLQGALSQENAETLAATLKALADPVRLRILSIIAAQPDYEACVCYLTEPIGLSQPTTTHHLQILHAAGLVAREKRGAWVYYRIEPACIEAVRAALATQRSRAPRARSLKRA